MNDSQAMVAQSAKLAKEARERVSLETYKAAIDALRPFAQMHRSNSTLNELALLRGAGRDATPIFERDFAKAWEVVNDFDLQPENYDMSTKAQAHDKHNDTHAGVPSNFPGGVAPEDMSIRDIDTSAPSGGVSSIWRPTPMPVMNDEDAHARALEHLRRQQGMVIMERDVKTLAKAILQRDDANPMLKHLNERLTVALKERDEARRVAAALWSTLRRCAARRACNKQPWNELDERIEDALALVPREWSEGL